MKFQLRKADFWRRDGQDIRQDTKGRETGEATAELHSSGRANSFTAPVKGAQPPESWANSWSWDDSGKHAQQLRMRHQKSSYGNNSVKSGEEPGRDGLLKTSGGEAHPRVSGELSFRRSETVSFQVHPRSAGNFFGHLLTNIRSFRRRAGKHWREKLHPRTPAPSRFIPRPQARCLCLYVTLSAVPTAARAPTSCRGRCRIAEPA